MKKTLVRLVLVLALLPMSFSAASAIEQCNRNTTDYRDGNGTPLVCYECRTATYCYYN